jgi:serine/threonine protein phosphatase PrpC
LAVRARSLVDAANAQGGRDNITVLLVEAEAS